MLNLTSLREQVYHYLREEMHSGRLLPGSTINLNELTSRLGISKTPLRDALIQLETEGFVEILPRRGVKVAQLTFQDVKNMYEIIGILEGRVLAWYFDRITSEHIKQMENLNAEMRRAVVNEDFDSYYNLNLEFHNIYLSFSDNKDLKKLLTQLKQRLYDFPRRSYIKEWELNNLDEHDMFIEQVKKGDAEGAARVMRDIHWSFQVQKPQIKKFYALVAEFIESERALREANGSAF